MFRKVIFWVILLYGLATVSQNNRNNLSRFISVKSWTANYEEHYYSEKTIQSRPEVKTTIKISSDAKSRAILKRSDEMSDGYYAEWYGYGNGVYEGKEEIIQTFDYNGGEIVIKETIRKTCYGTIGNPEKNDYGEFWGGYLSIDLDSKTYGVSIGNQGNSCKSILTRNVEGLPRDFSDLHNLPVPLSAIFSPLGDKVEEWANYSGSLDNVEGINPMLIMGYNIRPELEPENELPKAGLSLKGQYKGKNTSKKWSLIPSDKTTPEFYLLLTDKSWIPEDGNVTEAIVFWDKDIFPEKLEIHLEKISKEPGVYLNSKETSTDYDLDVQIDENGDFKIEKTETGFVLKKDNPSINMQSLIIKSYDYGAYGELKAQIMLAGDWIPATTIGAKDNILPVPYDYNDNHIADQWEIDNEIFQLNLTDDWDEEDMPELDGQKGDGLSLFEEYRGILSKGAHRRLSPEVKELIVENQMGDIIEPGFELFEEASGIRIVELNGGELPKSRIVNSNHSTGHQLDQYGIVIKKLAGADPDSTNAGVAEARPKELFNKTPKMCEEIVVWGDFIDKKLYVPSKKGIGLVYEAISHEMGHSVGAGHHGKGALQSKQIIGKFDNYHIYDYDGYEILKRDYTIEPTPIGVENCEASGHLNCLMRYADFFKWLKKDIYSPIRKVEYRMIEDNNDLFLFCTSDLGKNNPYGDAMKGYGNCLGKMRVKDEPR